MPLACKTISDECAAFKAIGWLLLYRVWHNDPSSKLLNRKLTFVSDSIHCMLSQVVRIFSNRPKLGLEACAHAISRNLYHHVSACVNLQISVRCFKYQSSQPSMMSDHFQHCLGYHPAGADQLTPLACGHGIIAFGLMQSIGCAWLAIYIGDNIYIISHAKHCTCSWVQHWLCQEASSVAVFIFLSPSSCKWLTATQGWHGIAGMSCIYL